MTVQLCTTATQVTCRRCDAPLLVAMDEGLVARVDADSITPAQEIDAIVAGKRTYTHAFKELIYRDAARIRSGDPGPIHAEHTCTPAIPPQQLDLFGSQK